MRLRSTYATRIPATLTTFANFAHFTISLQIDAPKSFGILLIGSAPME